MTGRRWFQLVAQSDSVSVNLGKCIQLQSDSDLIWSLCHVVLNFSFCMHVLAAWRGRCYCFVCANVDSAAHHGFVRLWVQQAAHSWFEPNAIPRSDSDTEQAMPIAKPVPRKKVVKGKPMKSMKILVKRKCVRAMKSKKARHHYAHWIESPWNFSFRVECFCFVLGAACWLKSAFEGLQDWIESRLQGRFLCFQFDLPQAHKSLPGASSWCDLWWHFALGIGGAQKHVTSGIESRRSLIHENLHTARHELATQASRLQVCRNSPGFKKNGAARFSGTCVFRSWSTIRVGLEDGVFSFWIASFFLPGSLRGCFSATTSVAKSEVSARGISASYLLMMSGSGFITPWKRISFDHGTSQQTYKRYTISYFDFLYPHVLPRISRTKFAFPPSMEKPSRNPAHIPEGFSQCEPESGFKVCQIGIAIRNVVDYNCGNLAGLPPGWTSDIPKDRKLLPPTGFELPDRSSIITQVLYPLFRV